MHKKFEVNWRNYIMYGLPKSEINREGFEGLRTSSSILLGVPLGLDALWKY